MNSNNKGQGLALHTVIILIIGLIALVVVVSFFTGTTGKVFGPLSEMTGSTTEETETIGSCVVNQGGTTTVCKDHDNKEECEQDHDGDGMIDCKWSYI